MKTLLLNFFAFAWLLLPQLEAGEIISREMGVDAQGKPIKEYVYQADRRDLRRNDDRYRSYYGNRFFLNRSYRTVLGYRDSHRTRIYVPSRTIVHPQSIQRSTVQVRIR